MIGSESASLFPRLIRFLFLIPLSDPLVTLLPSFLYSSLLIFFSLSHVHIFGEIHNE